VSYDLRQQAYNNNDDDKKQRQQHRYVFITRMRKASTGNGETAMAEAESVMLRRKTTINWRPLAYLSAPI